MNLHSQYRRPANPDQRQESDYTHDEWFRVQVYWFVYHNKTKPALWANCKDFMSSTNCCWPESKLRNEFYRNIKEKALTDTSYNPPEISWHSKDELLAIAREIAHKLTFRNEPKVCTVPPSQVKSKLARCAILINSP